MKICAALTCQSTSENNPLLIWHRLPKKYPLKRKWNQVLGIKKSNQNCTFVCSEHFDTHDYYQNKSVLKPNIVPTLNLVSAADKLSSEESPAKSDKSDDSVICMNSSEETNGEEEEEDEKEMKVSVDKKDETKSSSSPEEEKVVVKESSLSPKTATVLSPSTPIKKSPGVIQIRLNPAESAALSKGKSPRTAAKIAAQNLMRVAYFPNNNLNNHLANSNSTEKPENNTNSTSLINFKNLMRSAKIVLIRTNKISLSMLCAEEPLTQGQLDNLKNAQEEYDLITDKISSFEAANAKVIFLESEADYDSYVADNPIANSNSYSPVNGETVENSDTRDSKEEVEEDDDDIQIIGFKAKEKQTTVKFNFAHLHKPSVLPVKLYSADQFQIFNKSNLVNHLHSNLNHLGHVQQEMVFSESNIRGGEVKSAVNGHRDITPRLFLNLFPTHSSRVPAEIWDAKLHSLQNHLVRTSRFLLEPLHWMIKMGLIRGQPLCRYCSMGFLELVSNAQLVDRYIWVCKNIRCRKKSNVTRMNFYDKFASIPLSHLLLMTYYWAVQHKIEFETIDARYLSDERMQELWYAFRDVCKKETMKEKLGGLGHIIEISTVKLGRLRVFGAYDRQTRWVRLKAEVEVCFDNQTLINETIMLPYLEKGSILISTNPELNKNLDSSFIHHLVSSEEGNPDIHIKNISHYLMKHLQNMFGNMKLDKLKLVMVQGLLNELQWREKYGRTPANSFWNILQHIASQSGENVSFESHLDLPISDNKEDVGKMERMSSSYNQENHVPSDNFKRKQMSNSEYENAAKKMRSLIDKPLLDSSTASLDAKFYSRKRPNYTSIRQETKGDFKFKCPICEKLLKSNIATMDHMKRHMESQKLWKPDLTDLTTCKYCYREFDTPHLNQTHIERVHLIDNPICCRICNSGFTTEGKLERHLNSNHNHCEMPYSCQACLFRSSFLTDVFDHFTFAHMNTSKLLCPYCLKVFEPKTNSMGMVHLQTFYYHLHKHQSKSVKKCNLCCLAFINLPELKTHKKQDHNSWKSKAGVFSIRSIQSTKPLPEFDTSSANTPTYIGYISDYKKYVPSPPEKKLHSGDFNICSECKDQYKENHFGEELFSCSYCTFTTHCKNSIDLHRQMYHSSLKSCFNTNRRLGRGAGQSFLGDPLFCICGFYSSRGNRLARHLVLCEKKTCYPMTSLSKPSRRCLWTNTSKDKEEASWINTSWMAPIKLDPLQKKKPPPIDESTEEGQKLALLRYLGLQEKDEDDDSFFPDFTFPSPDHTYTSSQMVVPLRLSSSGTLPINHFKQDESNNTFILCDDSENSLEELEVNNNNDDLIGNDSFVGTNINPHIKETCSSSTSKSKVAAADSVPSPEAAESPSSNQKQDFEIIEISDDELNNANPPASPSSLKESCKTALRRSSRKKINQIIKKEEVEEADEDSSGSAPLSVNENGILDSVSTNNNNSSCEEDDLISNGIISKSSSLNDVSHAAVEKTSGSIHSTSSSPSTSSAPAECDTP